MLRNRIIYGIFIVVLIIFIYIFENKITYLALYSSAILMMLSFVLALVSKKFINFSEELSKTKITKGENVLYNLTIKNKSALTVSNLNVFFNSDSPAIINDFVKQTIFVKSFETKKIIFNLKGKFKGNHKIGVKKLTFTDMLGLFTFKINFKSNLVITVLPRILPLNQFKLSSTNYDSIGQKFYNQEEDTSLISDLRDYIPTDGYKKIHWKMSAKKNQLISKNYQTMKKNDFVLLIDNSKMNVPLFESLRREDQMIEAFLAIFTKCVNSQFFVSVDYIGNKDFKGRLLVSDYSYLLNVANNIEFNKNNFIEILQNSLAEKKELVNLIVFAQKLDEDFYLTIKNFQLLGNVISILCFGVYKNKDIERWFKLFQEINVNCYWLEDSYDLLKYL